MHKIDICSDIPCAGNICTYTCHAAARSFACVLCLCVHSANKVSSLKFHYLHAVSPIGNATCSRTIFLFLFMPHIHATYFLRHCRLNYFSFESSNKKTRKCQHFPTMSSIYRTSTQNCFRHATPQGAY